MRSTFVIALSTSLFLLTGCPRNYKADTQPPAAAGKAVVKLDSDKTGNGTVDVGFEHLAPPNSIDPSLSAYVVWAQVDGKDPYKLGIVEYKENKRSGKLSATYSEQQFKLFVTIEQDPNTSAPIGARILDLPVVAPKK